MTATSRKSAKRHGARGRRTAPGFTLVEMIVAAILLVIAVVAALAAFSSASQTTTAAENMQTAALLGQKKLTEIELQPDSLSSGGDQQGDFGDLYPSYRWQESVETTDYPSLYRVTLRVLWGAVNAPRQREFVTYLRYDPNQQNGGANSGSGTGGVSVTPATTGGSGGR